MHAAEVAELKRCDVLPAFGLHMQFPVLKPDFRGESSLCVTSVAARRQQEVIPAIYCRHTSSIEQRGLAVSPPVQDYGRHHAGQERQV